MILGVDTGGTFTDFVLLAASGRPQDGLRTHKVLSTPDAPQRAILQGIEEMGLAADVRAGRVTIIHGSTVATNAVLEDKGARTAFVTNRGFKDMLTIARQTRPALYKLETPPLAAPVEPELCLEINCRMDFEGNVLQEPAPGDLEALAARLRELEPAAVAINLLFSFVNDAHERMLEAFLRDRLGDDVFIYRSSFVLPEYREYERGIATWLNAKLAPLVRDYLLRLRDGTRPSPVSIMQSSGGTIDAGQAAEKSVHLLLSGPAGGLAAACYLSRLLHEPNLITFDMGGTSTDTALVASHEIKLGSDGRIGRYPIAVPMVDMHTIGAGGGSIAYVDSGNLLQVGPRSAGASPGPACYGRGGTEATVTDANLVLGRLLPEAFMGGAIALDKRAAVQAVARIADKLAITNEEAALGIIDLANEHMSRALRVISVGKGHDPLDFRLCCFGGAGGLHICALADAVGMTRALVPIHAGVLSALGMLVAPVERQVSLSHRAPLSALRERDAEAMIGRLREQALAAIRGESDTPEAIELQASADLRYAGQSFHLNLPWTGLSDAAAAFHAEHESRYGHRLPADVELVNLRVAARIPATPLTPARIASGAAAQPLASRHLYGFDDAVPVFSRDSLRAGQEIAGPALIAEDNATTLIAPSWTGRCDEYGNLLLDKQSGKGGV